MKKIKVLFINSCVRGKEKSRTYKIAEKFLESYKEKNPEHIIDEVEIMKLGIMPIIGTSYEKREKLINKKEFFNEEFELANKFAAADKIVIAAPFWDLSFPSILKIYIEHISVAGITFEYGEKGIRGLCKAKSIIYITSCGGDFSTPFMEKFEQATPYLKYLSEMFGIREFYAIKAYGLDMGDYKEILDKKILEAEKIAKIF